MKILYIFSAAIFLSCSLYFSAGLYSSVSSEGKKEMREEILDVMQTMNRMRAFPNNDIPADGYSKAYTYYRQHFFAANKTGTYTANWRSMGPKNIGGRTLCIALDPIDTSIVWLGSASGGLWKSTTGGIGKEVWKNVPINFPVLGVSSIAINNKNNKTMFIGTGETYYYGPSKNGLTDRTTRGTYGMGILKSIDGGKSWSKSLDWSYQQGRGIWEIVYNALDSNIIYAATTEGVYKSTDAGSSWNLILNKKMVMDIEINALDTSTIFAGVGNLSSPDHGLFRSKDGGKTWTQASINTSGISGRITITSYSKNPKIIMALVGNKFSTVGLFRSENGGDTWKDMNNNTTEVVSYQGWYAKCLLIHPDDSSKIITGGVNLFGSQNSGNNLTQISSVNNNTDYVHSDMHDIIFNPKDHNKIYILCDGGLFRSDDFGITYSECADGYVTSQMYIGSVSTTDTNLVLAGLQDNYTDAYDSSKYWKGIIGGDGSYNLIDSKNDSIVFASYQYLNVYKTANQGANWSNVISSPGDPNGGNPAAFLAPFAISEVNHFVMYAGSNVLKISSNGGNSFFDVSSNLIDSGNSILSLGLSYQNEEKVYMATAPDYATMKVFLTTDAGAHFSNITNNLPQRFSRRISVNPKNDNIAYIVFSGFGSGHIFRTNDAGKHWSDVSTSLPDVPFHCLLINPNDTNELYAGCDFGTFVSTDGGQTWSDFSTGMPNPAMVFDLVYSRKDSSLLAFTHGYGMYKCSAVNYHDTTTSHNGIQNISNENSVNIFPSPAHEYFYIDMKNTVGNIYLYNLAGELMYSEKNISLSHHRINVYNVPTGLYIVKTETEKNIITKKIILY